MKVYTYQLLIALTIVLTNFFGNERALSSVTYFWSAWTLTHVFTPWLMFLQFSTIGLSWLIAKSLRSVIRR